VNDVDAARDKVTVVLATYNGEDFLEQQLRSLAEQELLPDELIATDDGSTDRTLAMLHEFAASAPFRVSVSQNDVNVGFAANFLGAAERSSGGTIAFADQDDVWEPEKLRVCVECLSRNPEVAVVVHALQATDAEGGALPGAYPRIPGHGTAPPLDADPWLLVPGVAVVFDARLLEVFDWRERPPSRDLDDLQHLMDHDEWIYLLGWNAEALAFVDRPLVRYRQHAANLYGAPTRGWRHRISRLLHADFATQRNRTAVARALEDYARRSHDAPLHAATDAAADYWHAYRVLSERRDVIHAERRRLRRARRIARLIAQRGYTRRVGLGRIALLRDLRDLVVR